MHVLSTNLPVHILLTPISPRFPALHRISRVLLLLLLSANALLRRAPRARRSETTDARLRNRLPVSDVLGRLLAPLCLLLRGGFGLLVDGGFGLAQLAAGLLVGDCVCVLAFVSWEEMGVSYFAYLFLRVRLMRSRVLGLLAANLGVHQVRRHFVVELLWWCGMGA